jgi:hypothetical protein
MRMGVGLNRAIAIHHKMDDLSARGADFSILSKYTSPSRVNESITYLRQIFVTQSSQAVSRIPPRIQSRCCQNTLIGSKEESLFL